MNSSEFLSKSMDEVSKYTYDHFDKSEGLPTFTVYIVWYCKTLQNHKALLATSLPDNMYYECTYNGDKDELYIDAYNKFENICIKGKEEYFMEELFEKLRKERDELFTKN